MIGLLHALVDVVFFTAMMYLCDKRFEQLEDWSDDVEERLSNLKAREQAESYEVNYLMERAELQSGQARKDE